MSKELQEFLSIIQCAKEAQYAPLTVRSAILIGQLNAELIKVKNRDTYRIARTDFEAWLISKGRKPHQKDDNGLAMQCPQCSSKMEYPDCMECGYIVPGSLAGY